MAKYGVTYSCGHQGTVQLFGKYSDRARTIEWLGTQLCPDCSKKEQAESRAKESALAAADAKTNGLPDLVGSEKQIAWAETIRKNALSDPRNTIPCVPYDLPEDKKHAANDCRTVMVGARLKLENEQSAKWWIDNRNTVGGYVRECGRNSINSSVGKV